MEEPKNNKVGPVFYFIIGFIFSVLGLYALLTGNVLILSRHTSHVYSSEKNPAMFWTGTGVNFIIAVFCFYRATKQREK
jgi:hypothetical protein